MTDPNFLKILDIAYQCRNLEGRPLHQELLSRALDDPSLLPMVRLCFHQPMGIWEPYTECATGIDIQNAWRNRNEQD